VHVIKDLLTTFDVHYKRKLGVRYPVNGGKDSKLVKDLLGLYSQVELESFISAYFLMEDPFFRETGYSLGCFRGCLPKVIRHCHETLAKTKAAPVEDVVHWAQRMGYCRHKPTCDVPGGEACVALWRDEKRESA